MSVSTTLVKTAAQALLPITQQLTATITVGTPIDVSTKLGSAVLMGKFARSATSGLSNQLKFRFEGSAATSGNDGWYSIQEFTTSNATAAANQTANNGAISAGATSFAVLSATGIAVNSILIIVEGTLANSEWCRVASISGTTVTPVDPFTRSHGDLTTVYNQGEIFTSMPFDLSPHVRVRIVVDSASAATTLASYVMFWLVTVDSALSA